MSTYGLLAITGAWAVGGAQSSATRAIATGEIVMKKVLSLLQPAKSITRPVNERLDLSFAVNENDLRHILTTHVPAEPDEAGLQHLCRILCCVTERPSALSIAHDGADTPLLSIIVAYMAHATGLLSATADLAENMRASDCTVLLWRDCGNAVALLHAATRLFVQLVATPQYRFLLLQHELPAHVHRALARLADCVHVVLAAAAGDAGKLDGREAVDAGSHSQVDISNEPPLWALMSTVQSSVLLLGSLWQAGFGTLHAPEGLLRPTLSRLSDSVEALLRAPPTMHESLLPASTAGANTGSGISFGPSCSGGGSSSSSSSAGCNDGSSGRGGSCVSALGSLSTRLSAHAALLLRQIQLCERVRVQSPAGSPCWVLAIRAQRHGVAALGALMETVPEAHVLMQQPEGIRVVLECLSSSSLQRSGDEALPPRQLRLMLQLQMQCAMIALQAASVSHHEAWMRQWREAAGSRSLAQLLRWVCSRSIWADSESGCSSAVGDPTFSETDAVVAHDEASAPSRMAEAAHRPSVLMDSRTAADMLLARVSRDVAVWGAGLSAAQLGEWCENLLPPVTHSSESALPLAAGVGSSAARAAAAAGSECAAEMQLVFGFFRSISDYSAARETLLAAILCAFLPSSGVDAEAADEARDQRDDMGNGMGDIGDIGADDLADLASGWQHELLRMLRDRGTAWILPSSRLAPLAARLLCGERFLMRHTKSAASHEEGGGRLGVQVVSSLVGVSDPEVTPPPLLASATILSRDGELITAWRGTGDAAVPVSLSLIHI